jgi:hypothetical protein
MRLVGFSLLGLLAVVPLSAQYAPGKQGSSNVRIVSHIPLGGGLVTSDIEIERELSRPYAYVGRILDHAGFNIINLKDPSKAYVMYRWTIENPELHQGLGGLAPIYLKSKGRYYFALGFQFARPSPDYDLGAIVWDVTGLPDTSKIREAGRIRHPAGFHETYAYKHSNGAALLLTTIAGPYAHIYDIDQVVGGGPDGGLVGRVPVPEGSTPNPAVPSMVGYHDFYVGYDPASHQDRFYGAGIAGYYVYDISDIKAPRLLTSLTGIAGVPFGHTFTPTPDGRYAVAETEFQYAPLRIFDLKPGLDGQVKTISRPIGAWTARWQGLPHNHEVRWPYVFVGALEDGMHIFNMMDPTNPYTVAYYDTYDGPHEKGLDAGPLGKVFTGAWNVDVRNADGLIVASDFHTGFWAFKLDGFDGWNGHQWGMPNISSEQDWDNGPEGAPKKTV